MANEATTLRNIVAAFTDFLTVAIHTILYERAIYPQTSFLSARKYNFAVRQNRHPKVCGWINDAVSAVETELLKGTVERVAIVIFTKDNQPVERFMLDVSRFPTATIADLDTPLERKSAEGDKVPILPKVDMEEQFRATLSRLANCGSTLRPPPEGCTFTVAIELKSVGQAPVAHPQPWMPVEATEQDGADDKVQKRTVPVRAVSAGEMMLECWIEESAVAD
ncbi:hypothetical protein LTR36_005424 [Oleoguttula mirabilis]|uniref:HORMA domain-containing protein n=1 Tax=Oleoguttula mirabilis TaxID=1507867 RepID=A0AAV9JFC5_9PEZI|nr:hypothetical protein LTR36_005424 [Oleoguttula mirabilis]